MATTYDLARQGDTAPKSYDPLVWLQREYDRTEARLTFPFGQPQQVSAWRRKLRKALGEALGFPRYHAAPLRPKQIGSERGEGFVRRCYELETIPGLRTVVFVVLPEDLSKPRPGIVCCSGHTESVNDLVGLATEGGDRELFTGYQHDFAIQAAREGFVAAAHEQIAWGRRQSLQHKEKWPTVHGCWQIAMVALQLGMTLPGLRAFEAIRVGDFLRTLPEVNPKRVGITGISSGGNVCLFAGAMDPRFDAVVTSGYYCTYRDSIVAQYHCMDHYVPGLGQLAEMSDVAALVAPKGFMAETGTEDTGFPVKAVRKSFARVRAAYETMGLGDRCKLHVFKGDHHFEGVQVWPWFHRFLDC
ncbi:MAG: acetylxylan esterase [Armatimonadetes bacterium]|nr:acetylxylan esterase [Armatimonadota bacterium]